jgi:hypothetical protein
MNLSQQIEAAKARHENLGSIFAHAKNTQAREPSSQGKYEQMIEAENAWLRAECKHKDLVIQMVKTPNNCKAQN